MRMDLWPSRTKVVRAIYQAGLPWLLQPFWGSSSPPWPQWWEGNTPKVWEDVSQQPACPGELHLHWHCVKPNSQHFHGKWPQLAVGRGGWAQGDVSVCVWQELMWHRGMCMCVTGADVAQGSSWTRAAVLSSVQNLSLDQVTLITAYKFFIFYINSFKFTYILKFLFFF